MKKTYEGNIQGNEFKMLEYFDEHFYDDLESTGTKPSRRTETTMIYKNGEFWGKRIVNTYHGNWNEKQRPANNEKYELTVGDEANFVRLCLAIAQEYYD